MSEQLHTKRLHISGLTPSITPVDLERRLSSFGKVKEMDGFGARDALGDPRKFGFVTMEIGAKELAKCFNVLSGSTWKGAKLRIGEAKPDFRERLAQFNSQPPRPVRLRRIRARNHGYPSPTLPLTTPLTATAAASDAGWIVAPSGRVIRPMRMRPERPLEPMCCISDISKGKSVNGKTKTRVKPPLVRARRRLINPTRWDSLYLTGAYFDEGDEEERERCSTDSDTSSGEAVSSQSPAAEMVQDPADVVRSPNQLPETKHSSDVEMGEISSLVTQTIEPIPSTNLKDLFALQAEASFSLVDHLDLDVDVELDADILGISAPTYASQENGQPSQSTLQISNPTQIIDTKSTANARSRVTLDPSHPLVFPLPESLPHSYAHSSDHSMTTTHAHDAPTCFSFPSARRTRYLQHLPPSATFTRLPQETPESIRERWERDKPALTHEWKKAWREARGSRRGGRGAAGEVG